ncbi:MAG: hypothetical protein H7321_04250 [Bacteroidia bacterium]|nr:hypothetical protein [Bacteroidia bacterium]
MKNLQRTSWYVIALFLAVQLLSSCGSVGLTKMRYSRGYNFELFASKKKQEKLEKEALAAKEASAQKRALRKSGVLPVDSKAAETETVIADETETVAINTVETVSTESPVSTISTEADKTAGTTSQSASVNSSKKITKAEKKELKQAFKQMKYAVAEATHTAKAGKMKTGGDSDANLILLVVLSLFPILCLIAVYLHDGDITTNFWITLLLHFLLLYWLYALLVVLDVIDLS